MPLLQLTEETVFDPAGGSGVLLDSALGLYFELNPATTLMLDAALRYDTMEEVVQHLAERIDAADDDVLREGVTALAYQLTAQHLAEPSDLLA
jgi:hypothetical protein